VLRLNNRASDAVLADSRTLKVSFNVEGTERGMTFRCDCTLTVTTAPDFELPVGNIYIGANGTHPKTTTFSATEEDEASEGIVAHTPGKSTGLYIGHDDATETWTVLASKPSRLQLNVVITANANITQLNLININSDVLAQPSRLLLQTATGFVDAPNGGVVTQKRACESVVAGDFDNDMDVDLYLVCRGQVNNLPNILLENDGHGVFTVVPQAGGAEGSTLGKGEAAAVADYDNDGFLDIAITNGSGEPPFDNGPYQLFHNKGNGNHWLELDLRGVSSNRDGGGAKVILTVGGVSQLREQDNGVHRLSQNSQRLHFGLAQNKAASKVVVYWPSGTVQTLSNVPADQILQVSEDGTTTASFTLKPASLAFGNQVHNTTSAPKTVTLTNTGASPLPVNSRKLGGTNPGQFLIQSSTCPVTVAVGASCAIRIAFMPTSTGYKSATLTVQAGGGAGSHSVSLTGRGT